MNKIKVSIIMAEYNTNLSDLKESIKSMLNQTFKDFELIVVDDGGKNDLDAVVKEFGDDRIKMVKNGKNKGFVYSLNNAIKHANTEYLVRMDTDDISMPNRIQKLYEFITNNPEYDVVSSRAMEFSGNEEFGAIGSAGEKGKKEVMRGDVPVHAAAIMKKSAIESIGGYKEEYKRAEDLALWCDLLLAKKRLFMLDDVLYRYRVNKQDYKKRSIKYRGGEIKARLHYYPKMGAGPIEYLRIVKSIIAGLAPIWLVRLYRNNFVTKRIRAYEK